MMDRKVLLGLALFGMISVVDSGQVFAVEGDSQTIDGTKGEPSAEIITRGNLGDIDPTNPETPLPEGDDRWIKVVLPTAVVFESTDQQTIRSPKNYEIRNESGRPVKVDVTSYIIDGGNGVPALTQLNIKRSVGYVGNEIVNLVTTTTPENKEYPVNRELVRLANNKGVFGDITENGHKATNFEFTGTMDKDKLAEKQNFIESKLKFKFTALRLDGKTVEESK